MRHKILPCLSLTAAKISLHDGLETEFAVIKNSVITLNKAESGTKKNLEPLKKMKRNIGATEV